MTLSLLGMQSWGNALPREIAYGGMPNEYQGPNYDVMMQQLQNGGFNSSYSGMAQYGSGSNIMSGGFNTTGGFGIDPNSPWSGMDKWFGGSRMTTAGRQATPGILPSAVGAIGGLANVYLGMKNYGLAKKAFRENRRQFQLNYDAMKQNYNTDIEDRQRARVASNPSFYESVGSYMDRNRI